MKRNAEKYTVRDWLMGKPRPDIIQLPGAPVTANIKTVGLTKATKEAFDNAANWIWEVHDDGVLPKCTLDNNESENKGSYDPNKIAISINPRAPFKEETIIHEIGHFLHHKGLGNRDKVFDKEFLKPLIETIKQTSTFGVLQLSYDTSKDFSPEKKRYGYLKEEEELFARAYSQYILTKNGKLKEYIKYNINNNEFWPEKEFEEISQEFDKLFKSLKWRVNNG